MKMNKCTECGGEIFKNFVRRYHGEPDWATREREYEDGWQCRKCQAFSLIKSGTQ